MCRYSSPTTPNIVWWVATGTCILLCSILCRFAAVSRRALHPEFFSLSLSQSVLSADIRCPNWWEHTLSRDELRPNQCISHTTKYTYFRSPMQFATRTFKCKGMWSKLSNSSDLTLAFRVFVFFRIISWNKMIGLLSWGRFFTKYFDVTSRCITTPTFHRWFNFIFPTTCLSFKIFFHIVHVGAMSSI